MLILLLLTVCVCLPTHLRVFCLCVCAYVCVKLVYCVQSKLMFCVCVSLRVCVHLLASGLLHVCLWSVCVCNIIIIIKLLAHCVCALYVVQGNITCVDGILHLINLKLPSMFSRPHISTQSQIMIIEKVIVMIAILMTMMTVLLTYYWV
jgi:hypothetical protein